MEYKSTYFKPVLKSSFQNDKESATLHVVVPYSNYNRYKRREELMREFLERSKNYPNIQLYIVEVAYMQRPFVFTSPNNPNHLQLRTAECIWHKENMINLMIQRLPYDWEYVAWVDADIEFINKNWAIETIHQLQHYQIVQPFQTVNNLGPTGNTISTHKSFAYMWSLGKPFDIKGYYGLFHPGFAWAMRREAFESIGGLLDFAILGAGDSHMATAFIGKILDSVPGNIHPNYRKLLEIYQRRCSKKVMYKLGCVDGTIIHYFHASFKKRYYQERWNVLIKNRYDPLDDIQKDSTGLLVLDTTNPEYINLSNGILNYFKARQEDSIDNDDEEVPNFSKQIKKVEKKLSKIVEINDEN